MLIMTLNLPLTVPLLCHFASLRSTLTPSVPQTYTLAFTVGGVTNCATLATALSNYIQSGQFVSQSDGLLIGAVLTSFSCTGAGSVSFDNPAIPPPSQAPSSAPVPGVAPEPGVAPAPAGLGVASGSFTVNTMAGVQLSGAVANSWHLSADLSTSHVSC